ncbi:MAG: DUF3341 domain-containing protein [Calditrichaeota bacterium]|nr:MAG: DUF3341 domain-containing protein [Calditrichota bacterium]
MELYGLLAEFETPDELIQASKKAYEAGYRKMDAYTPFPVEGLPEAVGFKHPRLALLVLIGGIVGALVGFSLQYYASAIDYPLNIGGRPLNSWPSFIVITFELTILFAAFTAVLGMFALNGLPQPYHPVFNVERFALASRECFFLCIESEDPQFDLAKTRSFLEGLRAKQVFEVEP